MTPTYQEPQRSGLMTALVIGALIALLAAVVYLFIQVNSIQSDMAGMRQSLTSELAKQQESSSVSIAAQQKHIEALKAQLEDARTRVDAQAQTSAQAKQAAIAHADNLARQIAAEEAQMKQNIAAQQSEIGNVKQTAAATEARVSDVSTDVGTVKTRVSANEAELQKTIATLKSVQGDLGVASGLIATNGNELAALKLRGDRNYIDVKLGKTKKPERFADITLLLKKTDPKHNRYSVEVMADDKVTRKDNKSINEPVQFYTSKGGHTPYELVINQVAKNQIVGYLATPKEQASR